MPFVGVTSISKANKTIFLMALYDYFLQKFASNHSNYIGAKLSKILCVLFPTQLGIGIIQKLYISRVLLGFYLHGYVDVR
jgi:hypothetical protein